MKPEKELQAIQENKMNLLPNRLAQSNDQAANDPTFASKVPAGLANSEALMQACLDVLGAPRDTPLAEAAHAGMKYCISASVAVSSTSLALSSRVASVAALLVKCQAPGTVPLAIQGRKGAHLVYEIAIQVGHRVLNGEHVDASVCQLLGVHLTTNFIHQAKLSNSLLARIRSVVVSPAGKQSQAWTQPLRNKALRKSLRDLNSAIAENPVAARNYGLAVQLVEYVRPAGVIEVANRAFRRRALNLIDYSTQKALSGADGYGSLSLSTVKSVGEMIQARVEAGEPVGCLIALEFITHLPSKTMGLIPIKFEGCELDTEKCLAWIDLCEETFNYRLFNIIEKGARPAPGTEKLYEETSQVVSIRLPRFLISHLKSRISKHITGTLRLLDLLGEDALHDPKISLDDKKGYRHTARRVQESLPIHLVQAGFTRWPVALATNSLFLVSKGRRFYGVCRQSSIDQVVIRSYEMLGWPVPTDWSNSESLIGSFVAPKESSIWVVMNFLSSQANARAESTGGTYEECVKTFNAHAFWIAADLCLSFLLRGSRAYELQTNQLLTGNELHVNDKDVHESGLSPLPIPLHIKKNFTSWTSLCKEVIAALRVLGGANSLKLADKIEARCLDKESLHPVFTIDVLGELCGVGHSTWQNALPPSLRLVKNFGRHFWPLNLIDLEIEQLGIDILMRHQISVGRPGASTNCKIQTKTLGRLQVAMDLVLDRLSLKSPPWKLRV